jgi:hypothetical protein
MSSKPVRTEDVDRTLCGGHAELIIGIRARRIKPKVRTNRGKGKNATVIHWCYSLTGFEIHSCSTLFNQFKERKAITFNPSYNSLSSESNYFGQKAQEALASSNTPMREPARFVMDAFHDPGMVDQGYLSH